MYLDHALIHEQIYCGCVTVWFKQGVQKMFRCRSISMLPLCVSILTSRSLVHKQIFTVDMNGCDISSGLIDSV